MLFFRWANDILEHSRVSHSTNSLTCSFFKTLVDHEVTVELKNDIQIKGTLKSVDQYLNIKLDDIQVVEELKYPHLVSLDPLRQHNLCRWARPEIAIRESCANLAEQLVLSQERLHQR